MSIVRESISFQRGLDPKAALNVGKRAQIEKWFSDVEQQIGTNIVYTINDDLSVYVNDYLYLEDVDITELPENLTVKGSLDLEGTNISKLPNNLTVNGYLDLSKTNITKLPKNLKVDGWINLRGTKITELPTDLKVGEKIHKDF